MGEECEPTKSNGNPSSLPEDNYPPRADASACRSGPSEDDSAGDRPKQGCEGGGPRTTGETLRADDEQEHDAVGAGLRPFFFFPPHLFPRTPQKHVIQT
jgi:hypothetical protein